MTAVIQPSDLAPAAGPAPATTRPGVRRAVEVVTGPAAISYALGILAGLLVWVLVFAVGLSGLVQHHKQSLLYAQFRQQVANQSAPVGAPIARGAPVATLSGPHLSRQVVVEGTSSAELRSGPGLLPNAVLPGQAGTSEVLGRSTTFGGPFGSISHLKVGDRLTAATGQGVYAFTVVGTGLSGQVIPNAFRTASARLVLVTSANDGFLGIPAPGRTRYVFATAVGPAAASGASQTATSVDQIDAADPAQLYPLVLWLQLLLVVVVAATVVNVRLGRRYQPHLWVVALPIGLASLWGASLALFGVLPNLL